MVSSSCRMPLASARRAGAVIRADRRPPRMSPRKGVTVAERISEREAEVLTALGPRLSNAQIANRLHISVRTVESHVSSLLRKYGLADRWALAELARSQVRQPGRIPWLPPSGTTFISRAAERAAV